MLKFIQSTVLKINKQEQTHQVVFKRIGNYATDVHNQHIPILVNLSKIIDTPVMAMITVESYVKNVYHQPLMYNTDKHQAPGGSTGQGY
jgi:hypothetical protein